MLPFALNHMTVARLGYVELLDAAAALGCVGVEVRNDLPQPLFDGLDPAEAGAMARRPGPAHPRAGRGEALQRLVRRPRPRRPAT